MIADRQTHRQTYSIQYFAIAPAGELSIAVIIHKDSKIYTTSKAVQNTSRIRAREKDVANVCVGMKVANSHPVT